MAVMDAGEIAPAPEPIESAAVALVNWRVGIWLSPTLPGRRAAPCQGHNEAKETQQGCGCHRAENHDNNAAVLSGYRIVMEAKQDELLEG